MSFRLSFAIITLCRLSRNIRLPILSNIKRNRRRLVTTVENIIYYMDLSKGSITLNRMNIEMNNFLEKNCAIIEVSDNGKSIKKEVLENIFAPFNMGDIVYHSRGLG